MDQLNWRKIGYKHTCSCHGFLVCKACVYNRTLGFVVSCNMKPLDFNSIKLSMLYFTLRVYAHPLIIFIVHLWLTCMVTCLPLNIIKYSSLYRGSHAVSFSVICCIINIQRVVGKTRQDRKYKQWILGNTILYYMMYHLLDSLIFTCI